MDITIVGSGTLLPDDRHRSAGHLVEWRRGSLLLDCGSGVVHGLARDRCDWRRISHVALSHFHTDHTGDLPALLWAWKHGVPEHERRPRTLIGPPGTRVVIEALATAYGEHVLGPEVGLEVVEMGREDVYADEDVGLRLRSHPTRHTPESIAFRVEVDGRSVGYTGDTGPHPPLEAFFRGVDALVAECALPDSRATETHLSPSSAAALAVAADPAVLVLTHLYPGVDRRTLPDLVRSLGYTGLTHVGEDGLRIRPS